MDRKKQGLQNLERKLKILFYLVKHLSQDYKSNLIGGQLMEAGLKPATHKLRWLFVAGQPQLGYAWFALVFDCWLKANLTFV